MASERIELFGEFMYPKVFEFNRDKQGPNGAWADKGGACTIDLLMDEGNYQKYKESGARLKVHEEDGSYRVKFRRMFTHDKIPELGGAPRVANIEGKPWEPDEDGLIGNGSKGFVQISVYDTATGKGTRLEGIQVVEHVPYESDYDPTGYTGFSDKSDLVEGKKTKAKAKASKAPVSSDPEDDLPF